MIHCLVLWIKYGNKKLLIKVENYYVNPFVKPVYLMKLESKFNKWK